MCSQVRIESDPKEWPAQAAQLAAQRQQHEALQASVRRVSPACMLLLGSSKDKECKAGYNKHCTQCVSFCSVVALHTLFQQAYQPCETDHAHMLNPEY